MAEGAFRAAVEKRGGPPPWTVDSAAIADWNLGSGPDGRAVDVMRRNGIDISRLRARQVSDDDFHRFDLILGMDADNVRSLIKMKPAGAPAAVALFLEHALGLRQPVPDPYFGSRRDFEQAFKLIWRGAAALCEALARRR